MATSDLVDLRSDTVTRPSAGMRRAMLEAEVGDDVFGDDPTVNRLQALLAQMLGFEAGLFMPSGTQSNLAALMAHCQRGDEVLVGQSAHAYRYEGGGAAVLGSIQPQPLENEPDGSIALERIAAAIKPDDPHYARTRLLALENTIGGKVSARCPTSTPRRGLAHERGLVTPPGRRAPVQRRDRARRGAARGRRGLRFGVGVPEQGDRRAGRQPCCSVRETSSSAPADRARCCGGGLAPGRGC